jgi:hypothetical protein
VEPKVQVIVIQDGTVASGSWNNIDFGFNRAEYWTNCWSSHLILLDCLSDSVRLIFKLGYIRDRRWVARINEDYLKSRSAGLTKLISSSSDCNLVRAWFKLIVLVVLLSGDKIENSIAFTAIKEAKLLEIVTVDDA